MTFEFQPVPEAELKSTSYKDLKPGIASFKILDATDLDKEGQPLVSRNGTFMMKVTFKITDCEGNQSTLYDYFHDKVPWKIHQLLQSVDRAIWYSTGKINPFELISLFGQCILKEETSQHGKSIKIFSYIEKAKQEWANDQQEQDLGELPF